MSENLKSHQHAHEDCRYAAPNKPFPGLLGAQLDEWRLAKEETKHVGHDVIDDDHRHRHDEPDHALEDVDDDEVALRDYDQQSHVRPGEQGELAHVVAFLQGQHEPHKPNDVHEERDEPVICDGPPQQCLGEAIRQTNNNGVLHEKLKQ